MWLPLFIALLLLWLLLLLLLLVVFAALAVRLVLFARAVGLRCWLRMLPLALFLLPGMLLGWFGLLALLGRRQGRQGCSLLRGRLVPGLPVGLHPWPSASPPLAVARVKPVIQRIRVLSWALVALAAAMRSGLPAIRRVFCSRCFRGGILLRQCCMPGTVRIIVIIIIIIAMPIMVVVVVIIIIVVVVIRVVIIAILAFRQRIRLGIGGFVFHGHLCNGIRVDVALCLLARRQDLGYEVLFLQGLVLLELEMLGDFAQLGQLQGLQGSFLGHVEKGSKSDAVVRTMPQRRVKKGVGFGGSADQ